MDCLPVLLEAAAQLPSSKFYRSPSGPALPMLGKLLLVLTMDSWVWNSCCLFSSHCSRALDRFEPAAIDVTGASWVGDSEYRLQPSARRFESYEMSFAAKVRWVCSSFTTWLRALICCAVILSQVMGPELMIPA